MPDEYTKIVELFRLGVEPWNRWFTANREASFIFKDETFEENELVGYHFPKSVTFRNCHFNNVTFQNCAFQELRFEGDSDLDGLKFLAGNCSLDCEFSGANGTSLSVQEFGFKKTLKFEHCKLDNLEIRSANIKALEVSEDSKFKSLSLRASSIEFSILRKLKCDLLDCTQGTFVNADFRGADIKEAYFEESALKRIDFRDARFGAVSFAKGRELERLSFDNAEFAAPPDFTMATFKNNHPPSFAYARVDFPAKSSTRELDNWLYRYFSLTDDKKAAAKFRILRSLANQNQDHQKEMEFFAQEQRAKVGTEETNPLWYVVSWFFDEASRFGQSILRPVVWWVIVGLAFRHKVYPAIFQPHQDLSTATVQYENALSLFTYSHMVPLIIKLDEQTEEFIGAVTSSAVSTFWIVWAPAIHSALSTIFIFLFFLGIRNRFKIR